MSRLGRVLTYGLEKFASAVLTMFVIVTVVFILSKLVPGDEARVVAGPTASPGQVEEVRRRLGLTGSVFQQYLDYIGRLVRGDLGVSDMNHAPVLSSVMAVIPSTAELVVAATLLVVVIAFPLAAWSTLRRSRSGETTRRVLVVVAAGIPAFWFALVLQQVLASQLGVFPIAGNLSLGVDIRQITGASTVDAALSGNAVAMGDSLWHLLLPAFALALPYSGQLFRVLRAEMLSVNTRLHITVARAVGVQRKRLVMHHVLPQVLTPALSIIGVEFGALFAGAVLVESIFNRPGIGSYLLSAVANKDIPSILGGVLVIGLIVVLANYVVDIVQVIRDPRLRTAEFGS